MLTKTNHRILEYEYYKHPKKFLKAESLKSFFFFFFLKKKRLPQIQRQWKNEEGRKATA